VAQDAAPLEAEGRPRACATPQGRWKPITADGIALSDLQTVPVTRYCYRGSTTPSPWVLNHA